MSSTELVRPSPGGNAPTAIVIALLFLLGFFPPETRGESLAGCAAVAAMFVLLCWHGRVDDRRAWPLCILALVGLALTIPAAVPGAALLPLSVFYVAGALGLATSLLPHDVRRSAAVAVGLVTVGSLVALYGLYQYRFGLAEVVAFLEQGGIVPDRDAVLARARGGRAFAAFPTPAAMGGYLALTLPVTVYLARARRRFPAVLLWIAGAAQLAGLAATASATAVGALGVAALGVGLRRRIGRRAWIAIGAVVAVVAVAVVSVRGVEVTRFTGEDSAWRLRLGNYRVAASMTADHPWAGVGPGGYGGAYSLYRRPTDNESRHAHNLPLELVAETGVPVGSAAAILFFVLFLSPLAARGRVEEPSWWDGARIGLAAFALHNLGDFTAFLPSVLWTAAILRGWVSPASSGATGVASEAPRLPVTARSPGVALAARGVLILACGIAAVSGLGWNARSETRDALARSEIDQAVRFSKRATDLEPWSSEAWMLRATSVVRTAAAREGSLDVWSRAMTYSEQAVNLDPRSATARALRAQLRYGMGDLPGAFADATMASRLHPARESHAQIRDRFESELFRENSP